MSVLRSLLRDGFSASQIRPARALPNTHPRAHPHPSRKIEREKTTGHRLPVAHGTGRLARIFRNNRLWSGAELQHHCACAAFAA
jgi:hypothetical protein